MLNRFNRSFVMVDAESNGLHGRVFAIGAVLKRPACDPVTFYARCPIVGTINDFVREHVLPALDARWPERGFTHTDEHSMRTAFWRWLAPHMESGVPVFADCPWPVEAGLFSACIADDPTRRGPYPLYDATTLLMAAGMHPMTDEQEVGLLSAPQRAQYRKHDPVWDATVSSLCVLRAMDEIERRP